ncbi:hypothetical protein SDJN02_21841, partial [Cucurbita argyrosperma subsp. argyrosperma]
MKNSFFFSFYSTILAFYLFLPKPYFTFCRHSLPLPATAPRPAARRPPPLPDAALPAAAVSDTRRNCPRSLPLKLYRLSEQPELLISVWFSLKPVPLVRSHRPTHTPLLIFRTPKSCCD